MTTLLYKNFKNFFLALAVILPLACNVQSGKKDAGQADNTEINFSEDNFEEAIKLAKSQNKYVFVDAYTVWCGPCKMLKRTTFKDSAAAAFYNKNFINVAVDMEKGKGPVLGQQWGIQGYPTLLVFNPQGKMVLYTVGYIQAPELIRFGKDAMAKAVAKK